MWHVSVRATPEAVAWAMAEQELRGLGDASAGEWRERGEHSTVHLRRRLSDAERAAAGGLGVRDIRGMPEERARLLRLLREVPQVAPYLRGLL